MERGCRNCMWLYHMVTYNPTAPCSECLDHDKWQTTKRSNADKIRQMSDEELAEFIGGDPMHDICPNNCHEDPERPCAVCILDWLKQEAET